MRILRRRFYGAPWGSSESTDHQPPRPYLARVKVERAETAKGPGWVPSKEIMATVARPNQALGPTGNHDFYDKEASDEEEPRRFTEAFSLRTPYSSRVAGGIHFVMLASEMYKTAPGPREWAWLTEAQLTWFDQVLTEHKDLFTVVCLHQPLQDSVVWSFGGNDFGGCGQHKELRQIVKQHPQVKLWLSGHVHMGADVAGNAARRDGLTFLGLGSTFYQFVHSDAPEDQGGWPSGDGFKKDLSASQSRMMEVWPDRVVIRARDHARQVWLDEHEVTINR